MCIGIPMKIVRLEEGGDYGICCRHNGETTRLDLRLVAPVETGSWVLAFMDAARSTLPEEEALRVANALEAVELAMRGESVDHLFADLIDREPELPDFLQSGLQADKNQA